MTANRALTLVTGHGWLRGFGNLLDNELARWWKTPLWWIVSLVYAALTFFLLNTGGFRNEGMFVYRYSDSVALFHTVGVLVVMQGVLVGDKKDGVASLGNCPNLLVQARCSPGVQAAAGLVQKEDPWVVQQGAGDV